MPGKVNPNNINFAHSSKNKDGSSFDPDLFGGWELELNGESKLSIPLGWEIDGSYQFPVGELGLEAGEYSARLRLNTVNPEVFSDWTAPSEFEIQAVPSAPFDFSIE